MSLKIIEGGKRARCALYCHRPFCRIYPLSLCICKKNEQGKLGKLWSITDEELGARTVTSISNWTTKGLYGCKHPPLFDFVPMQNVVVDTLHLFLRILDVLLQHFLADLTRQDFAHARLPVTQREKEKPEGMVRFEEFLQKDLKINFSFTVNKESKKIEHRDLTGPEKLKVFHNISLKDVISDECRAEALQEIWDTFIQLINELKVKTFDSEDVGVLAKELLLWLQSFLKIYQTKDVTPYIHAFVNHVPQFIALHGKINIFNQQGLEKFNDTSTQIFFHGSNMRGLEALRQTMLKRNRLRILEAEGYKRGEKAITCRNCNGKGHSILTCSEKCRYCNELVCCRHLTKVGTTWITLCSKAHVLS